MTSEELADIRTYVAERAAARARGEHIDSDERREAALIAALDEARARAEAAEKRGPAVVTLERLDRVLREYPDADVSRLAVSADEALRVEDRLRDMQRSRRRWIDAISYGLGVEVEGTADEAGEAVAKLRRDLDEARAQLAALQAHVMRMDALDDGAGNAERRGRAKVIAEVLGLYDVANGCAAADLTPVIEAAQALDVRARADERAKALREVIAYLEAESADDTRDYCTHLRAMADEAERGPR